jgi:hypothetical protein
MYDAALVLPIRRGLERSASTSVILAWRAWRAFPVVSVLGCDFSFLAALGAVLAHTFHFKLVLIGPESPVWEDEDLNAVLRLKRGYIRALVIKQEERWHRWKASLDLTDVTNDDRGLDLSESFKSDELRVLNLTVSKAVVALNMAMTGER